MSWPHTQWMLGQWFSKISRIASSSKEALKTQGEKMFQPLSQFFVSLSPDVGTSTNLSFSMDQKVYHPQRKGNTEAQWGIKDLKFPDLNPGRKSAHRFLRFEIAEAASLSCLAAFGKVYDILGIPLFPLMSVYDFFVKRALDQYFYALYWPSSFILAGTPSGVTLSPEGAQHGWKSDFQIPGQICWEPFFCQELDWILTDAFYRHLTRNNKERTGVLIRAVTKGADQKLLLKYLKRQAEFKKSLGQDLLCHENEPIAGAVNEKEKECHPDHEILNQVRQKVLKGAYPLIHFKGYKDYFPKENVVHVFAMGALGSEACKASEELLKKGIYANVIIVTSPDLLLGGLAHQDGYSYLKKGLDLDFSAPVVSVHDGEPGLLDNIGSIVGGLQTALAVRKHSLCGRPSDIYTYHGMDAENIQAASLRILQQHTDL